MKKILSILMVVSIALSTLPMLITSSVKSETENEYKKTIMVDNTGNPHALTNYQVFINITYDPNMQPDFDDLRFTWYNETSSEEVGIDYWLDKYVDSEYALVWVEVPEIRGSGAEVLYMYYGDPDAVSESNGEETFVFFDGFSTDTTSNYHLWSPKYQTGNPNEFSWDPNGWLFVNASIRERKGRNSNVHVYHKTAVMDPSEDQYWLETRCKAFGDGWLDYLGVCNLYKLDSWPQDVYFRTAKVEQGIRDEYPMNFSSLSVGWGSWECGNHSDLPMPVIGPWFRIGLGTASDGTVVGSFRDDNYGELSNLTCHTTHQDVKWWVDLVISRILTDDWATMHAYFDYVRVRKLTDPEPCAHAIVELPEDVVLVKKYFPVYNFSSGEQWYPCSFYFDGDGDDWPSDLYNNESYGSYTPFPPPYYAYVHIADNSTHKAIQYWLYYAWNQHRFWPDHYTDWDTTVFVILEKTKGDPIEIYYFFHHRKEHLSWDTWPETEDTTHPVIYVAEGSHGAYSSPDEMRGNWWNFRVDDVWQPGGTVLREEDFNWYLVGDSISHAHDYSEDMYCNMTVEWIEDEPQWEFDSYWWPREFPGDWFIGEVQIPRTYEAPWDGDDWMNVQPEKTWILSISGSSPINLLVTDPNGLRVGYDSQSGESILEIPDALYSGPGTEPQIIVIPNPVQGLYTVEVFGTEAGTYTLLIQSIASDGSVDAETYTGETVEGSTDFYSLSIFETGEIEVVSWEYIFEDTRRGTMLKISTDDKYFQFIAPDSEFSIKEACVMKVSRHSIFIWHRDNEIRLVTIVCMPRIDFCIALANRYLLIDKPGTE